MVHQNEEFIRCLAEIFFVACLGLGDNVGLRNAAHGLAGLGNTDAKPPWLIALLFVTQGDYG